LGYMTSSPYESQNATVAHQPCLFCQPCQFVVPQKPLSRA